MVRFLKRVLVLGVAVGAGYAGWRLSKGGRSDSGATSTARPVAYPSGSAEGAPLHIPSQIVPPGGPETSPMGATWVDPRNGACPSSHRVKATLSTGRVHLPGDPGYDRAVPDRCYIDGDAAVADGLRRSER